MSNVLSKDDLVTLCMFCKRRDIDSHLVVYIFGDVNPVSFSLEVRKSPRQPVGNTVIAYHLNGRIILNEVVDRRFLFESNQRLYRAYVWQVQQYLTSTNELHAI